MANRLLADREMPPVGKRWASNFVKRHKDLKTHCFRKYDYQRAKCEDPTIIRNWFRVVANVIAKYGIRLDEIYNFDETGFMMGVIASGMVVTGARQVLIATSASARNGMVGMGGVVRNAAGAGAHDGVIAKYSITLARRDQQNAYTA
ncbi:uncharacterized protein FRV6_16578 [Fusarium oxysporum]|uniref:HTH CENPB-type domain-containing protein n=1 Tax=Fusarium oxysporum TaxID=5507 RepID=A0A2H3U6B7_FUSOX|nr:uncharacterized protein FRV6_16578 [Fusarium oxysporum]